MKTLIALLILALPCAAQTRWGYVASAQNEGDKAELVDLAGATNVVMVVQSGTQVPVVSDSGLNHYEMLAQQGRLSVWVALNVDGQQDTVMVQNALAFSVAEYVGVGKSTAYGLSGTGFQASMFVSSSGPAVLCWGLDVYGSLSWPIRGPSVLQNMLVGKFILADGFMNAGSVQVLVPITSCNVGGGAYHMIIVELQ